MVRKRALVPSLGVAAVLAGQLGCASWQSVGTPLAMPSLTGTAAHRDELPKDQAVQACLAVAQSLDKGNNDAVAREQYEKVLQLDPNNQKAARRLAVLYDRTGDFAKADIEYAKLAKARPRDADLFNDWGYSFYARTKWADAEKHLRHALEIDATHARARCNLGLALGQQGRYGEALEAFTKVVTPAEAHCNLAFVYWTQGKLEDARRECLLATSTDATCTKAQEILAQLDLPPRTDDRSVAAAPRRGTDHSPQQKRAELRAQAEAAVAQLGTPSASGDEPKPVYRSPNGMAWVPVPAKTVAPAGPSGAASGTITWE